MTQPANKGTKAPPVSADAINALILDLRTGNAINAREKINGNTIALAKPHTIKPNKPNGVDVHNANATAHTPNIREYRNTALGDWYANNQPPAIRPKIIINQ